MTQSIRRPLMAASLAVVILACNGSAVMAATDTLSASNPFAKVSTLPFEAPPFDRIKDGDYKPALEAGMAEELKEVDKIANSKDAPSFDNTVGAMEHTGELLARTAAVFQNLTGSNTDPTMDKVNEEEAPRLQAHDDAVHLNPKLFVRIKTLYDERDTLKLDANQKFLLERYYTRFVRAGAQLSPADQKTLKKYNEQIASLTASYLVKLQAASNAAAPIVADKAALAGASDAEIAGFEAAAKAKKLDGKYVVPLTNTTQQPVIADLSDRALRQQIMTASETRGDAAGPNDVRDLIASLAQLRAKKAKLFGFDSYAAYVLDDQMAKNPATAKKLLTDLVPASVAKAHAEAADIQTLIDQQKGGFTLTAADWDFYGEQVRKAKYAIDANEVRQYFELDRVLQDGVFFAANQLYGLTFKERKDLPVYQPDVRVFEVFDADGKSMALFYVDYFKRPNKNGGAWCNLFDQPSGLDGRKPIVVNVANFTKPAAGEPALLSFDDVVTMFHEFGHALHAMFSVQYYPTENGFNLPTDVIEFPSQFNEHWALDPTVFAHYAKHYKTSAVMPAALVDKIKQARTYGKGYATTELLGAALLDQEWHSLAADAPKQVPDEFEAAALKKDSIDVPQVPPRYRSTYFLHIWGNGYAANYYSYLWGEILDDDAFEWFTQHGGLTRANGQRFRDMMLGPGYTNNPMTLYRAFRGADPSVEALKRERGLVAAATTAPAPNKAP